MACNSTLRISRTFLGLLFLTVLGILWAFVVDDTRPLADSSIVAWGWSPYNIVMLLLVCLVAIEAAERRASERFRVNRPGLLTSAKGTEWFVIGDISATGMRMIGEPPTGPGSEVRVRYQELDVKATVVREGKGHFGLHFVQCPETRKALIQHVYAGAYNANIKKVRPARVAKALFARVFS